MKAAIIKQLGDVPVCENFPDPIPQNENEILINVTAASVKNLDKLRASGRHYASYKQLPAVVGFDGVGILEDGTRVYAQGISGMIAERALIPNHKYIVLPEKIDDVTAAALPNAVIGSAMALQFRAKIQKGNVVLINGATGVTGQVAVQLAKHYGASKVIATGRNEQSLAKLTSLGADTVVSLKAADEAIVEELKAVQLVTPVDIVIDYLWGHSVELLLKALKGAGGYTHPVRIVTVGSISGEEIELRSDVLRSSAIEILGSGIGSLSEVDMKKFITEILPEAFQLAATGKLVIETITVPLDAVHEVWSANIDPGKRLVICM